MTDETGDKNEVVTTYKGYDKNLKCRDQQYEIGKTYELNGPVVICQTGFHACENPLDVFGYYAPGEARFTEVTQTGDLKRHGDDSKVASAKITIGVEIHLHEIIQRGIKWIFDRATLTNTKHSEVVSGAASNSGDSGAASNSGYRGAASNSGYSGAASNSGDSGAASNSGYSGAASNSGDSGAAMNSAIYGRVMGCDGSALFMVYRDPNTYEILHTWSGIVGKTKGVKSDVWYTLNEKGKPVEWK